ncbi:hypothetical protein DBR06_SOUSAS8010327 [Sousa chinensis]|nr:hypothetical protein DBR06_SOUSAS8010327 [Sousa chinensis]
MSPQRLTSNERPQNLELSVSFSARASGAPRAEPCNRPPHLTTGLGALAGRKLQPPACRASRRFAVYNIAHSAPVVVVRACALVGILLPEVLERRLPRPPGRWRPAGVRPPLLCCPPSALHHAARCAPPPPRPGPPRAPGPRLRRGRRRPGPRRGPGTDVFHLRLTHAGVFQRRQCSTGGRAHADRSVWHLGSPRTHTAGPATRAGCGPR